MVATPTSLARGGIEELCRARLDATTFRRELRARLARILAFDTYCVNTVDPVSRVVTSSVGDGLAPAMGRLLFEIEHRGSDFHPLCDLVCPVTMHRATDGDVCRSERMRKIFVPLGLRDELRAPLNGGGHTWGYLHLYRSRAFTESEVDRVAAITSHLGAALRFACLLPLALANEVGVVLVREGSAVFGDEAQAWCARLAGDVGDDVPHAVVAAAAHAPVRAHHRTVSGAWVSVHASRVGSDVAVVLAPAPKVDTTPILFAAHALTKREVTVAKCLLGGDSNASIAETLGISLHTAKDHVKSVFGKTRTSGRAELLARFG